MRLVFVLVALVACEERAGDPSSDGGARDASRRDAGPAVVDSGGSAPDAGDDLGQVRDGFRVRDRFVDVPTEVPGVAGETLALWTREVVSAARDGEPLEAVLFVHGATVGGEALFDAPLLEVA
ncbi:MAG: hypothetical protein AAGH15_28225, partial [Myxococcota bacterium]